MGSELGGGGACCHCSMASSPQLLFLLILACLVSSSVAAATDTLRQGDSLSAPAKLVSSPAGVFEMGFFAPDPKRPSRLYLGIWYRSATPRAVVWVGNRAAPAASPSPSLKLTDTGDLRVLDGGGAAAASGTDATAPPLWSSNTSAGASAAPRGGYSAVLQDSGSLQVRNGGEVLWDSFWHPTDTMLPGMQIAVQTPAPPGRASDGRMLFTSWASETDPAPGRYALGLDPVGFDQAYIWRDGNATFWRSGQWTGANFIGIPWRPLYMSGFIPVKDSLGPRYIYTATNTSSLQRIVVLPNGTDILYMVKKYTQEWEISWFQPSNCWEYAQETTGFDPLVLMGHKCCEAHYQGKGCFIY